MKKALCVLLSVVMLLSMSVTAFAADTKGAPSQTLPSWLPDDAPAPDPNSEISIVHFYINEDGETIGKSFFQCHLLHIHLCHHLCKLLRFGQLSRHRKNFVHT